MIKVSNLIKAAAVVALAFTAGTAANAATVAFSAVPATAVANPIATSSGGIGWGIFAENVTGTNPVSKNVWGDTDTTSPYSYVTTNYWAKYDFGATYSAFTFVWGSPDDYNTLTFYKNGAVVDTLSITPGSSIAPAVYAKTSGLATITNIAGGSYDAVMFSTSGNSFEYGNVAPVPVPAAGVMLLGALGGLTALRRRKSA